MVTDIVMIDYIGAIFKENIMNNRCWPKKFIYLGLLVLLAGMVFLPSCGSKSDNAASMSSFAPDAEQRDLIRAYQILKQTGLDSNLAAFVDMRDSFTMSYIYEMYQRKGVEIDAGIVASWAFGWQDVAGLPLVQDSATDEWRRLVFLIDGRTDREGVAKLILPMVLYRLQEEEWKVANATRVEAFKFNEDGSVLSMDQVVIHKIFELPPVLPNFDSIESFQPREPRVIENLGKNKTKKK